MVTDAEPVKSSGKVNRVSREEISVDTVEHAINLHTVRPVSLVCTAVSWLNPTHQKGNVSVFEEVCVVSYERIVAGCISLLAGGG